MSEAIDLSHVVALSVKIAAVRAKLAELRTEEDALKKELRSLIRVDAPSRGTMCGAILESAAANPSAELSVMGIVEAMRATGMRTNIESVRTTIARLCNEGKVRRVRRGVYSATAALPHFGP